MPKTSKSKFNPSQQKAIKFAHGPVLLVAGAGTGKTTVITERINYLVTKKNVPAERILALTFTDKAAAEMVERIDRLLPYGYTDLWALTFHGFAQKILQAHALDIGLSNDFKILTETQSWLLVRKNLDKFSLDYYRPIGNPAKFISALLKHFSRCKDELVKPKDYLELAERLRLDNDLTKEAALSQECARLTELAEAYHVYQQLLLANNYLDFGDLINYCLELFQQRPQILRQYQEKFQFVLVDEFQDTNYAQYELIKLLVQPRNNLMVVGDDDQSIYKFRGASVSNILQFKKDFPDCQEIVLTKNYRSRQKILDVAYKFIQLNNPNRLEAQGPAKISKKLSAATAGAGVIEHLHAKDLGQEVDLVINKIVELQQQTNCPWNDFAILVRANNHAKPFIESLDERGVPYQFYASRGLYAKSVVLDILAFLKLLNDYHQSDAMHRYLSLPIFSLPATEIIKLSHLASKKTLSLYEAIQQASGLVVLDPVNQERIGRAFALLQKFYGQLNDKKTSQIVFGFLNEAGYLKHIDSLPDLVRQQSFSLINQFYKRIKAFEEINDDCSVRAFLAELELELLAGEEGALEVNPEEGPEVVKVMTLHSAKGLEFRYVFMVNLVDRRFPTDERTEPISLPDQLIKEIVPEGDIHLQEERRLFYVGLTRAKEGVFLTSAEDYGGSRAKKISIFLKELGFSQPAVKATAIQELKTSEKIALPATKFYQEFLPSRFSYTQLKDFSNCPRLYYYRYIVRLPMPGNRYFSFGSTVHLTLQKFFEEYKRRLNTNQASLFGINTATSKSLKELVDLPTLLRFYENSWIDEWYLDKQQKKEFFTKGKQLLEQFYNSPKLDEAQPLFLEKPFSLRLGADNLVGKIDRIDAYQDGLRIIDYKTGKAKIKLDSEDKEQLLIYQMAVQELFPQPVKELLYYYLEADSVLAFLGQASEIDKLKEKLIDTIAELKQTDFIDFIAKHDKCQYCQEIL